MKVADLAEALADARMSILDAQAKIESTAPPLSRLLVE